jgi:hypothetical protein
MEHFGFRSKLSREMALCKLVVDILHAINMNNVIGGIFCNLFKAFNGVNHSILL